MSLRWLGRFVVALIAWISLAVLAYLAVPPHAATLVAVRAQCAPLPGSDFRACTGPAVRDLVGWTGRSVVAGVALALLIYALHPWWVRRRHDLAPLDDSSPALLTELGRLTGPGRQPRWWLAPYAYGERGRAFGWPWRPSVRIDVGLGILSRTDRPRFRAVVAGELDRLRDRAAGTRSLAAGCLVTLVAAAPVSGPAAPPRSSIDRCLVGYWTEEPRTLTMLAPDMIAAPVARRGAIWSFTAGGVATLHVGDETIGGVAYRGAGTIRWRVSAREGRLDLAGPVVGATLTGPDGVARAPEAGRFAPGESYTCGAATTTVPNDLDVVVLHRIGPG